MRRLALLLTPLLALAGCGGAAAHVVETYPDGRRVDYWVAASHVLTDPEISEVRTPEWSLTGFRSKVDADATRAVVEGAVRAIVKAPLALP
jgi:hypothetical protein